mgnify:CR=1 FL=1
MGSEITDANYQQICHAIDNGKIKLRACKEGESIWLMDSGSRPAIANMHKSFPGAQLKPSKAQQDGKGYASATGELFANERGICHPMPHATGAPA